jgi:hypothetical protein
LALAQRWSNASFKARITLQNRRPSKLFHYLAVWGCVSTGIVYAAVGAVAILSFLQIKDGGADEASLLVYFDRFWVGRVVIWIVLLGMVAYIAWRVFETITDPYDYGSESVGIIKRTGVALSSLADALIALSGIQALTGWGGIEENGMPTALWKTTSALLQSGFGWVLVCGGIITVITALVQIWYAVAKGYVERMHIDKLTALQRALLHFFAWTGHAARGIIIGIVGVSFVRAAITRYATAAVNTDKAFDFIGDSIGHGAFIAVAIGTVCYGVFMFAFGWWYNSEPSHRNAKSPAVNRAGD